MLKKFFFYFFGGVLIVTTAGCATLSRSSSPDTASDGQAVERGKIHKQTEVTAGPSETDQPTSPPVKHQTTVSREVDSGQKKTLKKGLIFAKTDFQGLLRTGFVQLFFERQTDPKYKFQLHIGDKTTQTAFPWDVKTVRPGYFFIELPVGRYKITSVSIPVGSTVATEKVNIDLEVLDGGVTYAGTLRMIGTKDKIKLGGVPVIKPGFEYKAFVINEEEEGIRVFHQKYPQSKKPIHVRLMTILGQ